MRIAYLINQYPKISHTFIRREILALEQQGFEVLRISLRGWNLDLVDEQDYRERKRTRYVLNTPITALLLVTVRTFFCRPIRFMRALKTAWQLCWPSERPLYVHFGYLIEACCVMHWLQKDGVVHLHAHFGTNSASVAMLVHDLCGLPWSFTIHGPEEFERPYLLHLKEKIESAAFAISVSNFGRAHLLRFLNRRDWAKIHVVHCGLDQTFIDPRNSSALNPASTSFVLVARFSPEKAHGLLFEAAERLAHTGLDFQLVLVGDGDLRSDIEKEIAERNLVGRVRLTGWLDGARVRSEISTARCLVLTSLAEGLPMVIMEAMALQRPVIAFAVAGVPELVRSGENGWLVPTGEVGALADAMGDCLLTPPDVLTRMGEAARDLVLLRHDAHTEAAKLGELISGSLRKDQVRDDGLCSIKT